MGISRNEIKRIRFLQTNKGRAEYHQFLVEGPKLVDEALASKADIDVIYAVEGTLPQRIKHEVVSHKELSQISGLKTPNASIAVVNYKAPKWNGIQGDLTLVLDRINDPGNLGTLLRIADWYGMKQLICSPDSVSHLNAKVVQSSMGAIFRVPVFYRSIMEVCSEFREQQNGEVFLAHLNGQSMFEIDVQKPALLVMGSESHGVDKDLLNHSGFKRIHIPGNGSAESLNVAVSAGILSAQLMKQ